VGSENFFLFGLTAGEVATLKAQGYHPQAYYQNNAELREVLDLVAQGYFSSGDRERFKPLVDNLLDQDPYLLLADYQSYVDCQDQVNLAYQNQSDWVQKSILNTARSGKFSSDRAIAEYCRDIWKISAVPIELQPYVQANAELVLTDSPP
jgi:starch phosphorylase